MQYKKVKLLPLCVLWVAIFLFSLLFAPAFLTVIAAVPASQICNEETVSRSKIKTIGVCVNVS